MMSYKKFIVLALALAHVLPVNLINYTIITRGAIILFEDNFLIILGELILTASLSGVLAGWILYEINELRKHGKILKTRQDS